MPDSVGTRTQANTRQLHTDQGSETRNHSRDVGMSMRVVTTATFSAAGKTVTGSNGDFANFVVNTQILIEGTNLNNGFKTVTGLDATNQAYLIIDPPPKDESTVANTIVRAA